MKFKLNIYDIARLNNYTSPSPISASSLNDVDGHLKTDSLKIKKEDLRRWDFMQF